MADSNLELALKIKASMEGLDAITKLGNSFVDINQKIETLIRGLTAISGSSEGAVAEFEYLTEQSKKYGISILDLSDNYVKFIAASKGTSLEGEAARKIFEATASTMAVLGGETITTHRAFTALSQMMSKGQIYAEELKGQLAEAIPGALQLMSKALGITTNEMLALMKAGQLSSDSLLPFAIELEKKYGSLAASSRTFAQAVNGIQTEWALLMKRLGDTGAWSAVTSSIELLSKHSEVLAGTIGAGLAAGLFKLISALGSTGVALKETYKTYALYGTAAERAAKAEVDLASASLASATAAVKNSESQLASSAISEKAAIAATRSADLHVKSLLAKNAVLTDLEVLQEKHSQSLVKSAAAEANVTTTTQALSKATLDLAFATIESESALRREEVAVRGKLLAASATQKQSAQNLVSLREEVAALEQKIIVLKSSQTQDELLLAINNKILTLNEQLYISQERLTAANAQQTISQNAATEAITNRIISQEGLGASIDFVASAEGRLLSTTTANTVAAEAAVIAANARVVATEEKLMQQVREGTLAEAELRNNELLKQQNLELSAAKLRYSAAAEQQILVERQLGIQIYSTLEKEEKSAIAAEHRANATQRAAANKVAAIQAEILALNDQQVAIANGTKQEELLATAEARRLELLGALSVATDRYDAANIRLGVTQTELDAATQRRIAGQSQEELALERKIIALERTLSAEQRQVAQSALAVDIAQRKVQALIAEGGTEEQVARAKAEAALAEDRLNQAKARSVAASATNTAAKNAETEALITQQIATNNLAKSQGILSKAWALLTGPTGMIALMVAGFAYMAFAFRDQDEATKALSKSTEEYTKSLEGMNAAQIIQLNNTSKELVDDKKEYIKAIEAEIESLKNESGAVFTVTSSWYGLVNAMKFWQTGNQQRIQAEADLAEQQRELSILEGKRAIGITALLSTYDKLSNNNKSLNSSNNELLASQKIQQAVVDELNSKWFKSTEEVVKLAKEQEKLNAINNEVSISSRVLSSSIRLSDDALRALTQTTGLSIDKVRAAFEGNEQYINSLDAKSQAIVRSIQRQIELNSLDKENERQMRLIKAEYDRLEGSVKSKTEAIIKEAAALGDLKSKRDAEIEQGHALISLAENSILSIKKEVDIIDTRIAQKKEEIVTNEKEQTNIEKQIGKLEEQRQGLLKTQAVRESNLIVVKAEAIATEVANNLISESFVKNQKIIRDSSSTIVELQNEYKNLKVTSEAVFNQQQSDILEKIKIKQQEAAEAARVMGVAFADIYKTLGLDYDETITGMDFSTRRMIDAFGQLGEKGNATALQIQTAFEDVLGKANTEQELIALRDELEKLERQGKISFDTMAVSVEAVNEKLAQTKGITDPVQASFSKLGLGVPEQLQSIANSFETAFLTIQNSEAPLEQVQAAFMKYAEAQIVAALASGKMVPELVAVRAESLGLSAAYQQLIEKSNLVNQEFAATVELFSRSRDQLEQYQAKIAATSNAELDWLRAKEKVAVILGDEEVKRNVLIVIAEKELEINRQLITANQEKLNAANQELAALQRIADSGKALNTEQKQRLIDLKNEIPLMEAQVNASKAKAEQSRVEAEATRLANSIISEEFARQQKIVEEASSEVGRLKTAYENLKAAGADVTILNGILNQIVDAEKKVADGAEGMDAAMNAAFDAVGLNYQETVNGMDADTKRMIDAFGFMAKSAASSAKEIQLAFTDVLAKANTEAELKAIETQLIQLGSKGKISGDQLAQSLAAVHTKAIQLRAAVDPLQIAMEKLGIGVSEKLLAAANEAEKFYLTIKNSKAPIDEVQQAFLQYAEKALLAAENGAKVDIAQLKAQASALGLGAAFDELKRKIAESSAEYDAIVNKYDRLNTLQEKDIAFSKSLVEVYGEKNQSSIVLNENLGKEYALVSDLIKEDQVKIALIKQEVSEKERLLEIDKQKLADLQNLRDKGEQLSAVQKEQLELLERQIPIDEQGIAISKEKVKQAESLALSYQNIAADINRVVAAAEQELNQDNELLESKNKKLEAEKKLAEASGDTVKAQQLAVEISKTEIEIATNTAVAKRDAAIAAGDYVSKLVEQANADGVVSAEELNAIAVARQLVDAKNNEASAAESTAEALKKNADAAQKTADAERNLKEANEARASAGAAATKTMNDALEVLRQTGGEMDKLTKRFYEQQGEITKNAAGWDGWAAGTARAAQEVKQAYETQKSSIEGMTLALEAFNETGVYNANVQQAMIQAGGDLASQFDLMDQQSFNNLRAKLEDANQKLREMQQETQDAIDRLAELDAELAAERGDTATADRLKLELEGKQAIADLDAQMAKAQMYGNRQLMEALSEQRIKLLELYNLKERNLEKDIQSRQEQEQSAKSNTDTSTGLAALADNAERARNAVQGLSGIDLSPLSGQLTGLNATVNGLRSSL